MTAREKAQAGFWMIEEAILQLIRENGRPMQPSAVSEALGLRSKAPDDEFPGVGYAVMQAMANTGKLLKGEGRHPPYSLPPSTH
jgi:hypothetical protein